MAEDVSRGRRHGLGDRSSPAVFFFAERRGRVASRAHGRAGAGGLLGPAGSYGEEPKALGGMRGLLNHAIPAVEVGKCCPPVVRCGLLAKRLTQSWLRSRWRTLGRSREKWIGRSGTGEQFSPHMRGSRRFSVTPRFARRETTLRQPRSRRRSLDELLYGVEDEDCVAERIARRP